MNVETFLKWAKQAGAADRARAAGALARAYLQAAMPAEDRRAAEAAMTLLLDDPSPKVRAALAEALGASEGAPRAIVAALAQDQAEVAGHVILVSPVLTDADLVDIVASGGASVQRLVALRPGLSVAVSAALAEVGSDLAVSDLLDNRGARIAGLTLRRIAERFGAVVEIRARLLDRPGIASDIRHRLMVAVGEALAGFALVSGTVGIERARRVVDEACEAATLHVAAPASEGDRAALVEHLRVTGRLTPALLMQALSAGQIDFFAAAIISLTGQSTARVRSILVDGRRASIAALYQAAGLSADHAGVFVEATLLWRAALKDGEGAREAARVTDRLLDLCRDRFGAGDLLVLVERFNRAQRRDQARDFARMLEVGQGRAEEEAQLQDEEKAAA